MVVRKDRCALGHIGLPGRAIGHLESPRLKALADSLENRIVILQRPASQFGHYFPGDIVRGRAESAGYENDIASDCGFTNCVPNRAAIGYGQLPLHPQPNRKELLGEKTKVGIDDTAEQ